MHILTLLSHRNDFWSKQICFWLVQLCIHTKRAQQPHQPDGEVDIAKCSREQEKAESICTFQPSIRSFVERTENSRLIHKREGMQMQQNGNANAISVPSSLCRRVCCFWFDSIWKYVNHILLLQHNFELFSFVKQLDCIGAHKNVCSFQLFVGFSGWMNWLVCMLELRVWYEHELIREGERSNWCGRSTSDFSSQSFRHSASAQSAVNIRAWNYISIV